VRLFHGEETAFTTHPPRPRRRDGRLPGLRKRQKVGEKGLRSQCYTNLGRTGIMQRQVYLSDDIVQMWNALEAPNP